jgi:hypothetical protein
VLSGFSQVGLLLSDPPSRLAYVNRTDRLYALVEEMRAVAPRPRSARWLAGRFEVSVRTVERDINALQQAGVPIYAEPGPHLLDSSGNHFGVFTPPPSDELRSEGT